MKQWARAFLLIGGCNGVPLGVNTHVFRPRSKSEQFRFFHSFPTTILFLKLYSLEITPEEILNTLKYHYHNNSYFFSRQVKESEETIFTFRNLFSLIHKHSSIRSNSFLFLFFFFTINEPSFLYTFHSRHSIFLFHFFARQEILISSIKIIRIVRVPIFDHINCRVIIVKLFIDRLMHNKDA